MKIWEDEKQVYIRASMERNTPEQNAALKERLEQIDWSILEHIQRKETVNERGVFAPLEAVEVPEIEARRDEFKAAGLDAIRAGKVGAVLLAGGQGTRLGLDRPKGTLNIGVNRELYLFEQLFRNLMDVTDEAGAYVPMYIMTSNINHKDTVTFFEEHHYFGYPKDYVQFFVQEMVPACDYEGRVYMESDTEVAMSPNGNGGWFSSMVTAGLLDDIHARGLEWINVFAVDNCLQRIADPLFIGATIVSGCESGAKVVRKAAPDEKVGVLCTEDGKPSIAANAIEHGYGVAYAAEAKVVHSHNYTMRQQFHRNFDLAVSQKQHPEIFEQVSSEAEGMKLVKSTIAYLFAIRKPWLVFHFGMQCVGKYAGFWMGRHYEKLSRKQILKYTMNPGYWDMREDVHE